MYGTTSVVLTCTCVSGFAHDRNINNEKDIILISLATIIHAKAGTLLKRCGP